MTRTTRTLAAVAVCTLAAIVAPVHAQELFGGYSYLRDPSNSVLQATADDNALSLGWIAGVAYPVAPWLAIVGEASGHYKHRTTLDTDVDLSFHAAMGGVRLSATLGRLTEFVHVLAGALHGHGSAFGSQASTTGFAIQPGGGVDYRLRSHIAARLQLDYRTMNGTANGRLRAHQFRASAGLVYRR
jgi:opacity protein-like surface antigen